MGEPRIFLRVAAYRDPECEWTLRDAFRKASIPGRVTAGVCWQYQPGAEAPSVRLHERAEQIRVTSVPSTQSEGVCWARHQTEQLWRGEEFTLQIDAHTRFAQGWDERLLRELQACDSKKPVLSANPAPYEPPDRLAPHARPAIRVARSFTPGGSLRFRGAYLRRAPSRPLRGAFIAAGFVFSSSELLHEVPYDPQLYFDQEEAAYAVRLFSHGWDVFSPSFMPLYHYYNKSSRAAESLHPLHWSDSIRWRALNQRGQRRFDTLTGAKNGRGTAEDRTKLGAHGLGVTRGLAEFEKLTGVDFENKTVSQRTLDGSFIVGHGGVNDDASRAAMEQRSIDDVDDETTASVDLDDAAIVEPPVGTPSSPEVRLVERDFVPFLKLVDQDGRRHDMETLGGSWTLMSVFVDLTAEAASAVSSCHAFARNFPNLRIMPVATQSPERVRAQRRELDFPHRVWCDPSGTVRALLGSELDDRSGPVTVLLTPNLRIQRKYDRGSLSAQYVSAQKEWTCIARPQRLRVVTSQAPVLLVPDVLSRDDARALIQHYTTQPRFDGKVGVAPSVYSPSNKIRTDCMVRPEIQQMLDERLGRRVLPEIEKVFGLSVTHREPYKLTCYDGTREAFFSGHRDNLNPMLRYRRYAISITLSDGFAGGELCFPEYGDVGYKPALGHAIVFPCALMHEVRRMRKGKRYTAQSFLFGEKDAERQVGSGKSAHVAGWRMKTPVVRLGLAHE